MNPQSEAALSRHAMEAIGALRLLTDAGWRRTASDGDVLICLANLRCAVGGVEEAMTVGFPTRKDLR